MKVKPMGLLLMMLAGWINRHQQDVITYLKEENKVLREKLGTKRILLNDNQRMRLAQLGKRLGRSVLNDASCLFSPDTILRWHARLVVRKYDGSKKKGAPGRKRISEEVEQLVIQIARKDKTWGLRRIKGQLRIDSVRSHRLGTQMGNPMPEKSCVINDEVGVSPARIGSIRIFVVILYGVVLSCLLTASVSRAQTTPIKFFDLGYTLRIDSNNRDQVRMAWDHCHAVAVLQGLVNRQKPTLYLRFTESQHRRQNVDDFWLEQLSKPSQWLHGRPVERIDTIADLVQEFRSHIRGLVAYDPNVAATSNVASAVAGAEALLPVRYDPNEGSLYRLLEGELALPVKRWLVRPDGTSLFTGRGTIPGTDRPSSGSAKCDAYLWMKYNYLDAGRCDGAYGAYYLDQYWIQKPRNTVLNHHCLTNHDFFVARNAFFFDLGVWGDERPVDDPGQDLGTDLETLRALLLSAYQHGGREKMIHIGGFVPWAHKYTTHGTSGGHHDPVPTEWEYGKVISAYNGFMDADAVGYGAMANASFFMHYPLRSAYRQDWVTREDLAKRGYLDEKGRVKFDGRDFLIFYVGDYDCAAWLYQRMMDIWDDPARGQIPMMWCISPVLDRRAPMAMDYMRRTATANDYFAAADNGAGYCEPGMLQEPRGISNLPSGLDAWARHCKPLYDRWGLSITGFIIYAHGPVLNEAGLDCYASFSGNGIVPSGGPASFLHGRMPVLRFDHDANEDDPATAARHVVERVAQRRAEGCPPFHWFRNILKTPTWYVKTRDQIKQMNPKIELLDAPTFFELYRIYLENRETSGL